MVKMKKQYQSRVSRGWYCKQTIDVLFGCSEAVLEEGLDHTVPLFKKVPDFSLCDSFEIETGILSKEAVKMKLHRLRQFFQISVHFFIDGFRGENGLTIFEKPLCKFLPECRTGPEAGKHFHFL